MLNRRNLASSARGFACLLITISLVLGCASPGRGQDFKRITQEENALREKYVGPIAVVGRVGLKNGEHPNGTKLSEITLALDADMMFFCTETYGQIRMDGTSQEKASADSWSRVEKATEIFLWGPGQSKKIDPSLIGKRVLVVGYPLRGLTGWYLLGYGIHATSIEVLR